jgi:hypothetical protein
VTMWRVNGGEELTVGEGEIDKLSREVNVLCSLLAASKKEKLWLGEIHDLFIMCLLLICIL